MAIKREKNIYFADFFAGIGGFHHAIKNVSKSSGINFICKVVSEIDLNAKKVYSQKFRFDINLIKDINDIIPHEDMNGISLIFCGFPCQTFSNAGKRKGFDDKKRGSLIFKVIEIVKNSNAKVILLENVKHLISHNGGKTYNEIINNFKKIGYKTTEKPVLVSPTDLGLPQNRERVFIPLIHESLESRHYIDYIEKPKMEIKNNILEKIIEKNVDKKFFLPKEKQDILHAWEEFVSYFLEKKIKIPVIWLDELLNKKYISKSTSKSKDWYIKYMNSMKTFYLNNKEFIDYWNKKYKPLSWKLRRDKKLEWHAGFETNFRSSFLQERQSGLRFRKPNIFPTLVATVQTPIIYDECGWRYLTPKEVSKLQDFPETDDIITCNDFQLYKQYGNSVNIKVVEWIINNYLIKYLEKL